jgi:acetyl esterase/lipase
MKNILQQHREEFDQLGNCYPAEASVNVEQKLVTGVNTYWFTPRDAREDSIIIHLHGGVYALGSVHSHGSLMSHITHRFKTTIVFVDYALAPERPYPAANNDAFAVYTAILKDHPGYKIGFIGDSAGGGLIVSTVGEILKRQSPLPYAVAMISPWVDLKCDNHSYEGNRAKDPILSHDILSGAANGYRADAPVGKVNPAEAALSTFPPILITVGTNEVLLDESLNFYDVVKALQPNSTLTIYENQYHVWPLSDIHSEASQKLLAEMDAFFHSAQ